MIDGYAGGHSFKAGICETCQRRLVDLRGLTHADAGKPMIAHVGLATLAEIDGINALLAKMDGAMAVILGF